MKTCIITVYNSENCGSFLQAFALKKALSKQGHTVSFLKRKKKGSSNSFFFFLRGVLRQFKRKNQKEALLLAKRHFGFPPFGEHLKPFDKKHTADFFVIGSDTLWEASTKYFKNNISLYTGHGCKTNRFISYAPSVGNATLADIQAESEAFKNLKNATALSGRDSTTVELIEKVTACPVSLVCDPTLLLEKEEYSVFKSKSFSRPYILLYCFERLNNDIKEYILNFAKDRGLAIISVGSFYGWCDKCYPALPDKFISAFADASFVFTNTFHGTVFSTIFEKDFIVTTKEKNKIREYLKNVDLSNRIATTKEELSNIANNHIDYSYTNKKIDSLRNSSLAFLENHVKEQGV